MITVSQLQTLLMAYPANAEITLNGHCCGYDTQLEVADVVVIHQTYMGSNAELGAGDDRP